MKLIINKDTEHYLLAQDINYNIIYQIQNYSTHTSSLNCRIENNNINNADYFEDIPITSIDIYNSQDILMTSFTFNTNNCYILNINTTVEENIVNSFIRFGTINIVEKQGE